MNYVDTMEHMGIVTPKPTVNLADIRTKYHDALGRRGRRRARP